jgi:hypothetical protein
LFWNIILSYIAYDEKKPDSTPKADSVVWKKYFTIGLNWLLI